MKLLLIGVITLIGVSAVSLTLLKVGGNADSRESKVEWTCDTATSFVSVFRELHGAGDYLSIWLDRSGNAQRVSHSGRIVHNFKTASPDSGAVSQIFDRVATTFTETTGVWLPATDSSRSLVDERGYSRIVFNKHGTCSQLVFHESNADLEPISTLIQEFESLFSNQDPALPMAETRFVVASPMLSRRQFPMPGLSNWYSRLVDRPGDLPVLSVRKAQDLGSEIIRAAIMAHGRFVEITSESAGAADLNHSVFYVVLNGGGEFYVRRMDAADSREQ